MVFQYIFKRVEKKYILDSAPYEAVLRGISEHMTADKFGETTICNIYFDDSGDNLIQTSIDKPIYKEKLRLRSYGLPQSDNDTVFLEIKKKYKGTVYKRRIALSLKEAEDYTLNGTLPSHISGNIPKEIDYMVHFYGLSPRIFIAYERTAYYCKECSDLRITFDKNIRSRYHDVSFRKGAEGERLFPDNICIMEIKIPNAAPLWLTRLLNENGIYSQSFSKYGSIYINNLKKRRTQ